MDQRYGLVLVPHLQPELEASKCSTDVIAERARDGWQLLSVASDRHGSEVLMFRRSGQAP